MRKVAGVLLFLLTFGIISAQTAAAKQTNSDTRVFALEMGTGFCYDLDLKSTSGTQTVSAIFGLNDSVQAGFTIIKGDIVAHNYSLVKIGVFPVPDLAVNLLLGGDGAAALISGFGMGYTAFRNASGNLTTALQFNLQYLFSDVSKGNLGMGLNLKVGL